jgi:hypothetical protein
VAIEPAEAERSARREYRGVSGFGVTIENPCEIHRVSLTKTMSAWLRLFYIVLVFVILPQPSLDSFTAALQAAWPVLQVEHDDGACTHRHSKLLHRVHGKESTGVR